MTTTNSVPTAFDELLASLAPALRLDMEGYHIQTDLLSSTDWDALIAMQRDGFSLNVTTEPYKVPTLTGEAENLVMYDRHLLSQLHTIHLPNDAQAIKVTHFERCQGAEYTILALQYTHDTHAAEIEVRIPEQPFLPGDGLIAVTYPILADS